MLEFFESAVVPAAVVRPGAPAAHDRRYPIAEKSGRATELIEEVGRRSADRRASR
jgi:hypothetical protein